MITGTLLKLILCGNSEIVQLPLMRPGVKLFMLTLFCAVVDLKWMHGMKKREISRVRMNKFHNINSEE